MKTRIIVGVVGLVLLLAVVLALPSVGTAILVAAMSVLAVYELLIGTGLVRHVRIFAYSSLMAVLVVIWSWLGIQTHYAFGMIILVLYLAALFIELLAAHAELRFSKICIAIFAGAVLPFLLGALIRLRVPVHGRVYIMTAFLLAMVPDTGAYFVGTFLGKHKLCPVISPHKTVEGAIGGLVVTILAMLLYTLLLRAALHFRVNYLYAVVYAILGTGASMLGDLTFSVIKRQTKIKDFGTLLPGHGGILDRFDSTSMVAPVVETLLLLIPFAVK